MTRPGPSLLARAAALLALAAVSLSVSCKGASVQVKRSVPADLAVSAVVVYPFGFRWETPAWRAVELSQRLVDVALAEAAEQALFFGPTEVRVYRPDEDNAWAASDAVAVLAAYGVRPDSALVLRPRAEKRVQAGQRELVDSRGRTVGQSAQEAVTYLGTVEVLHPATRQVVLEVSGEAAADPFAEVTDEGADPAPELTLLMADLTREALKGLSGTLKPPRAPSPPVATSVAWVPWETLELGPELAARDALDAELLRQQRLRFANPGLEPAVLDTLARKPGGLYVRAAPAGAKLAAGDIVLSLDGRPVPPQALARTRLAPVPSEARVQQASGQIVSLVLP
ncbi:hypothetical protein [Pyxidicoccus xibeiensis]|uniref:hypothetical protein n=1 Tax=Pyxidicoccus xibeiensis TaxID=2906759 RepID=UPI0020A6FA74|nr:hypothetical protein [Pyxidicoccus xibeiensis]MCP3143714.1 hypothetical protein [Pyxidicoccus xibeiensis]